MAKRVVTSLILMVFGLPALLLGGIPYYLFMTVFLLGASWEYVRIFRAVDLKPSLALTMAGVLAITLTRAFYPQVASEALTIFVLMAMAFHLFDYERGRDKAAVDFGITVTGMVYLGWVGSYLFDLRYLPEGGWWLFLVLGSVWLADSGAYTLGSAYGKHKMAPRLSPKKSWEGYAAGVFSGILGGIFFAFAFTSWGPLTGQITLWQGALLGLLVGVLSPLGDLGESMLKRQSGLKDSSAVFPGHGGFLDRIDSWLWTAVIGFYFVTWFLL